MDALQYAGDTLAASVEASHPDLDVRTEWAQFRGDTVTRDVVDEVRRAPAGGAFVTGTDPVNETRALSLSGGSRLLVQSIGDRAQRHTQVHLAGPGTAPFSPVTLPPEPAGNERFIRTARPVPGGHLLVWNDYAGGGVRSRVLFVGPSGRTTERTPALPDEGTPRSATVSGPVGGDGAPLLGSIGRQAVLLAGPPARTLTVQATVTLPDGYRVDRVAAGAGGYLATGWKQYSLRPAPAIFTSRDGVTWRTGSGDPLEARHRGTDLDLTGAVRAGSAWVVVGTETAERVTRGVALVSRDGSSWSPLRPRALDGTVTADTRVTALTAGRAGRVLAGGSVTTRDGWRPTVFPGGQTAVSWGRILLRLPAGSVSGSVDQLVADGTHRLASGSCPTRTGDRHCVWTSADQGVTWRPATVVRAADPAARVVSVDPFATGRRPGIAVVEEKAGQRSVGIVAVDADGGYGRRLPVDTGAFTARSTTMLAAVLGRGNLLLSGTTGPGAGEHAVTTVQPIDPTAFAPPAGGPTPSSSPSPSSSRGSSGSGGSG
ncbi:hypothetical protein GCM10011512_06660 [Tersicoccus solisilvae]|uniref:Exo-alpha-sialidase n=1 Tax=Tersicoccus solisilvae TaxID=1882339 RepID=A0ABQ1NTU9_9MICC|nr:hypothetical protein [Tersicoccus solisilvae]GGC82576.1 hypothetical protein GCM10011512_06660 [Tersicoccus solisilvae]